jgi:hypothetical protein
MPAAEWGDVEVGADVIVHAGSVRGTAVPLAMPAKVIGRTSSGKYVFERLTVRGDRTIRYTAWRGHILE